MQKNGGMMVSTLWQPVTTKIARLQVGFRQRQSNFTWGISKARCEKLGTGMPQNRTTCPT